ncbi:MAG: hypothetical protein AB1486_17150 [Planctomycetota bacterium]
MKLALAGTLALVGLLVVVSPAPAAVILNITPDFPIQGGDILGFSASGGNPNALAFLIVGTTLGTTTFQDFELGIAYPFWVLYGGHFNTSGVTTGGWSFPGSGPIPGLAGLTLMVQVLMIDPVGPVFGVSNIDQIAFAPQT